MMMHLMGNDNNRYATEMKYPVGTDRVFPHLSVIIF